MKNMLKRSSVILCLLILLLSVAGYDKTQITTYKALDRYSYEYVCLEYDEESKEHIKPCISEELEHKSIGTVLEYGKIVIDGADITPNGYYCNPQDDGTIHCVSLTDGFDANSPQETVCQEHGGMDCMIYEGESDNKFSIKHTKGKRPKDVEKLYYKIK